MTTVFLSQLLQVFYSLVATLGFALMFKVPAKFLPLASLCGALSWGVNLVVINFGGSESFAYFLASIAVGLLAELLAYIFKCPPTMFILSAIIPLVPGAGMYRMMFEMVLGDTARSSQIGSQTLTLAGAIAGGLAVAAAIARIIVLRWPRIHILHHKKKK